MAQKYSIRKNDTLAKIAKRIYGDVSLAQRLALFNGISDPNLIQVGQTIEIPSQEKLMSSSAAKPKAAAPAATAAPAGGGVAPHTITLVPPNGLNEILAMFGNIHEYLHEDGTLNPRWETMFLRRAPLAFPIPLSWSPAQRATSIYCHIKLRDIFAAVFADIQKQGLQTEIKTFGGCFNFRAKRTSSKLSTHSWGIAVDLNPDTNAQGTAGNMHPGVVDIFRKAGFTWGADFSGSSKDPMHFQYCSGY